MTRAALILAGGAGTRLQPLSSEENPKQFLRIFDGRSLLEMTSARARRIGCRLYISTTEQYAEKCRDHVSGDAIILAEPDRRNTAPAIALCCTEIAAREGDVTIAVLPSDHFIAGDDAFARTLDRAFELASSSDFLITIGIAPTEANTGYGYLQLGAEIAPGVQRVERFTEKPSRERAEAFVRSGGYAWNAGIFVWRASVFGQELARVAPELAAVTRANYSSMPSISIDYALMEKASKVASIRGDFGWSDAGSFEALARVGVDVQALLRSPPS